MSQKTPKDPKFNLLYSNLLQPPLTLEPSGVGGMSRKALKFTSGTDVRADDAGVLRSVAERPAGCCGDKLKRK